MRDLQDIIGQINTKGATLSFQIESITFIADHEDPTSILQRWMHSPALNERSCASGRQKVVRTTSPNWVVVVDLYAFQQKDAAPLKPPVGWGGLSRLYLVLKTQLTLDTLEPPG